MIDATDDGIVLAVRVIARSGRSGLAGTREGAIVVRLRAAPVDGAANAELQAVVAAAFGVARRDVEIIGGERSRHKRLRVRGIDRAAAAAVIDRVSQA
jgi:uncharacterized protein (TIGR00251 family)